MDPASGDNRPMNKTTRKSFLAAVLSVAFAGAALATAAPASAASDADRARDLLAPTLAAVSTTPAGTCLFIEWDPGAITPSDVTVRSTEVPSVRRPRQEFPPG